MKSKIVHWIRSFNLVPVASKSIEFKVVKIGLKVEHAQTFVFLTHSSTLFFFMLCAHTTRTARVFPSISYARDERERLQKVWTFLQRQ